MNFNGEKPMISSNLDKIKIITFDILFCTRNIIISFCNNLELGISSSNLQKLTLFLTSDTVRCLSIFIIRDCNSNNEASLI